MSTALPAHIGLIDDTGHLTDQLPAVAAALNQQIAGDFAGPWDAKATVAPYAADQLPKHTWAVHVQAQLDQPGALGYHTDKAHQPLAYVELTDEWTVTASHEILEMLADPWGSRLHAAELPAGLESRFADFGLKAATDRVHYLVEVCDPPEAHSYQVAGVALSDFLLPNWYGTVPAAKLAYSHAGGCTKPRQVADGGYCSFEAIDNHWWQVFNQAGQLSVSDLGKFSARKFSSIREWTDLKAREHRAAAEE